MTGSVFAISQPAIKILNFIRLLAEGDAAARRQAAAGKLGETEMAGFVRFETTRAKQVSQTFQALPPISAVDVVRWVEYWALVGMFSKDV